MLVCSNVGENIELNIEYIGMATYRNKPNQLGRKYKESWLSYVMKIEGNINIDATEKGGVACCMNHSCHSNCNLGKRRVNGVTGAIFLANRNIGYSSP